MLDALKNKLAEKARMVSEGTKAFLEETSIKVSDEIREERFNICKSCDQFHKQTEFCRICGCFMPIKTYVPTTSCPIKKWDKVENK